MKKTLVALAVLAASGASFAQVTVTGKLGFSYQKSAVIGNGNQTGLNMTDGDVIFGVTENLGNGMSIRAETAVQLRGRNDEAPGAALNSNQFRPRNASLTLTTPVGQFTGGAIESPTGHFRVTSYKDDFATGFDGDAGVWDGKANIDFVRFAAPIGKTGITASAWYTEVGSGRGNEFTTGVSTRITAPVLMLNYSAGPLSGFFDYTAFAAQRTAAGVAGGVQSVLDGNNRTRFGVDYNFGAARVAASFQTRDNLADQYAIGVSVPMGATTFHLTYGSRAEQKALPQFGVARADARTGTAAQAIYSMSKTTSLQFNYATYTGISTIGDEYRVTLFQRF